MCASCRNERDAAARKSKAQEAKVWKELERNEIPSKANNWAWKDPKTDVKRLRD